MSDSSGKQFRPIFRVQEDGIFNPIFDSGSGGGASTAGEPIGLLLVLTKAA